MNQPTPAGDAFQEGGVWKQDYNVYNPSTGRTEVKRFMHNGAEWVPDTSAPANTGKVKFDLTKKIPDTEGGIDLKKHVVNLDKCLVNLSKKSNINLSQHTARVAVVLDYSGSMGGKYNESRKNANNSHIQKVLNKLFPVALRFDDNGELEVWLFQSNFTRLPAMDCDNFETYVQREIVEQRYSMGGTRYAPVLHDICKHYINEDPSNCPAFVIFITDGDNADHKESKEVIQKSSEHNIFVQFVGIGKGPFNFLEKLDDLEGRKRDNTGFEAFSDLAKAEDDEVFNKLLSQYVDWLRTI